MRPWYGKQDKEIDKKPSDKTGVELKQKNNWAIAGISLGVLSIFFASVGIIPLSALVINIIALYQASKRSWSGRWLAVTGLILAIIYTLAYLYQYGHI